MADLLPESAIQHIQSFLDTKEAARSCLLSKSWLRSWSNRPDLDFDQSLFHSDTADASFKEVRIRNKFVDFVNTTLVNYTTQKLRIRKFRLSTTTMSARNWANSNLIDQWIGAAIESGVTQLHLIVPTSLYTLPETIFSTKSLLEVLDVTNCKFARGNIVGGIDFCNLKTLVLDGVLIYEHTMAELISTIPLAEKIILTDCQGFKRIKVANLYHLKVFEFNFAQEKQILEIEAPNLESFRFSTLLWYGTKSAVFYMNALSNLKVLDLSCASITDMIFHHLVSQLMVVEDLSLRHCHNLERISISSRSLKHLWINGCEKLVAVNNIDAPNLQWFSYTCESLGSSVSFVNKSAPRGLGISLTVTCATDHLDTSWFRQLRGFLMNINRNVSYLHISSSNQNRFSSASFLQALDDDDDPNLQPQYSYMTNVEHLTVTNIEDSPTISYPALLDGLIWSCRPMNLIISLEGTNNSDNVSKGFAEDLRNELQFMDRNPKTYWWQCIKDGEISSSLYKKLMHKKKYH